MHQLRFISLTSVLFFLVLWALVDTGHALPRKDGYRIGPEDILEITILAGGKKQVESKMVVSGSGDVNVPFIGRIKAGGLTLDALERAVYEPLARDYFVDPQVNLGIKEYNSLQFFISGAVKHPGMFKLTYIPTIMDLVASAGGVLPQRGNVAYVLKGNPGAEADAAEEAVRTSSPRRIDLKALLDHGNMAENIRLSSGDTVYIPLNTQVNQSAVKVYVQGEVKKPGVFDYQPGLTALAACIMAGGFDKFAAPNRARVIRRQGMEQEILNINLEKVQTGEASDLPLKPGDRIHIPESWL